LEFDTTSADRIIYVQIGQTHNNTKISNTVNL